MIPFTRLSAGLAFVRACRVDQLIAERGVAVLLGDRQVAVFLVPETGPDGSGRPHVYAVDHHDPFSGANVIARGIVGSRGEATTVASPVYKQVFDLATGECLTEEGRLDTWPVRVRDGEVFLGVDPVRAGPVTSVTFPRAGVLAG
ncbi:nitrite reductase small subunit NirD [Nocardioidaceae bacterium]|nr:nitrite reductase small subunit NirD [Nocardioidaceae bacterium]